MLSRAPTPLTRVNAPVAPANPTPLAVAVSHLQQVRAELIAAQTGRGDQPPPTPRTNADYAQFIAAHD